MPDTTAPTVIKQKLSLETVVKNIENIGKYLKDLAGVDSALSSIKKTGSTVSKTFFKIQHAVGAAVKKHQAYIAVAVGVTSAVVALIKQQQVFIDTMIEVGGGAQYYDKLRASFDRVIISSGALLTSLKDMAATMADFSRQGFVQFIMASTGEANEGVQTLQNTLVKITGSQKDAAAATSEFFKVAGKNIGVLENSLKILEENQGADALRLLAEEVGKIHDGGAQMQVQVAGWLSLLEGGAGPAVQSLVKMGLAGLTVSKAWDEIKQQTLKALAPAITKILQTFNKLLENNGALLLKIAKLIGSVALGLGILGSALIVAKGIVILFSKALWSAVAAKVALLAMMGPAGWALIGAGAASAAIAMAALHDLGDAYEKAGEQAGGAGGGGGGPDVNPLTEIEKYIKRMITASEGLSAQMQTIGDSASSLQGVIDTMGPGMQVAGMAAEEYAKHLSDQALQAAMEGLNKKTEENIKKLDVMIKQSKTLEERTGHMERRAKLMQLQADAAKNLALSLELVVAAEQARLRIVTQEKNIAETRLSIAKATYGTAALGVQAQMEVVNALEKEKASQIAIYNAIVQKHREAKAAKTGEGDLQKFREMELEQRNKILQITAKQLEQVKELRDGYIDAVQAQAFAAGAFEKIIITQEKNIGKGLDENIVKKNYLLGSTGGLGVSGVRPTRFGMSGGLEVGGKAMTLEDVNRQMLEHIKLMPDSLSRAISEEVSNIHLQGVDDLTNLMGSNNSALQDLNNTLRVSNDLSSRALGATGGLGATAGGRAGEVGQGQAMRTGRTPRPAGGVPKDVPDALRKSGKLQIYVADCLDAEGEEIRGPARNEFWVSGSAPG